MAGWTICELQYMIDHYQTDGPTAVAKVIKKNVNSVSGKAGYLGIRNERNPDYTDEEEQFLRSKWGKMTIKALAKHFKRSEASVETKAKKMKLGPIFDPGNFTQDEIEKVTGISHSTLKKYIERGLIRASWSKTEKGRYKQIAPRELERFLRENPDKWDSRRAKNVIKAIRAKELELEKTKVRRAEGKVKRQLPEELKDRFADFVVEVAISASDRIKEVKKGPEWYRQKQEDDQSRYPNEGKPWTTVEDGLLRRLYQENMLTYKKMGEQLGRSAGSINGRLGRIIIWESELQKAG